MCLNTNRIKFKQHKEGILCEFLDPSLRPYKRRRDVTFCLCAVPSGIILLACRLHCRWRLQVPPKHQHLSVEPNDVDHRQNGSATRGCEVQTAVRIAGWLADIVTPTHSQCSPVFKGSTSTCKPPSLSSEHFTSRPPRPPRAVFKSKWSYILHFPYMHSWYVKGGGETQTF